VGSEGFSRFQSPYEGMGTDQLCRIVVGISFQIGRDGHRDMMMIAFITFKSSLVPLFEGL